DAAPRARRALALDAAAGHEPVANDLALDLAVAGLVEAGDVAHVLEGSVGALGRDDVRAEGARVLLAGHGEDGADQDEIERHLGLALEPAGITLRELVGAVEILGDDSLVALRAEMVEQAVDILLLFGEVPLRERDRD